MTVFVDTNVFVYRRDAADPAKQRRADAWLVSLWAQRSGRVSVQVLQEYYAVVTRKLHPGLSRSEAQQDVRDLMRWKPLAPDGALFEAAWSVEERFGLSWWDAMIVAAAQRQSCGHLLSEDLQAGQRFGRVEVVSPFERSPSELTG